MIEYKMKISIFTFIVLSFNHVFASGSSVGNFNLINSHFFNADDHGSVGTMNVIQSSRFDNSSVGNFKVFKSDGNGGGTMINLGGNGGGGGVIP